MSDTKFTQGPWVAKQDPDGRPDDWCIGIEDGKIDQVAVCGKNDAPLIAAAPELFEACRLFVEYDNDSHDDGVSTMLAYEAARTAIRAAIQKATKEPT